MVTPRGWQKRFSFTVVQYEGKKRFHAFGMYFSGFPARHEFWDGQITIMRNGIVFDQTDYISEVGTHAAITKFIGLKKIASQSGGSVSVLNPEFFETDDVVIVSIPTDAPFDLCASLRNAAATHQAWDEERQRNPDSTDFESVLARIAELEADSNYPPAGTIIA